MQRLELDQLDFANPLLVEANPIACGIHRHVDDGFVSRRSAVRVCPVGWEESGHRVRNVIH